MAPAAFRNMELGETLTDDIENLKGRKLSLNLFSLGVESRKQNANISFIVDRIKDNKALTSVDSYFASPNFIRRAVRAGKDKIDCSYLCETSDKVKVKIKLFLITSKKVTNSITSSLRKQMKEFVEKEIKANSFDKNLDSILSSNLQKNLRNFLKKIYPLSVCEVKIFEKA